MVLAQQLLGIQRHMRQCQILKDRKLVITVMKVNIKGHHCQIKEFGPDSGRVVWFLVAVVDPWPILFLEVGSRGCSCGVRYFQAPEKIPISPKTSQ
jgi:hypothetical protein